ncbi:LysM peptidoglycan-binding domain-containing protein [Bacillus aerolatus]|uniref:LysM peptidoglycan-binding domain-containing protein n=1 Tax=Bacillus aerolatus TaxID=2653354 RepID=A0A6I1FJM8_9BACI|nr:3D domain-containing protein [Bacillus aerolatus]KAB7706624.1 LysM peptidoglycan-binding domain-containing protein [Bacillus aerolatus]
MRKAIMSLVVACVLFSTSAVEAASASHTVQRGDTLWSIAREYKTTVNQLKQWNNLKSDNIRVGQKLVFQNTTAAAQPAKPAASKPVAVKAAKVLTVKSTAYTASCKGCSGITATGINLKKNPNAKVIAVDPKVIPLGTKVYVEGYGEAIAGDKGGAIKGNKIDVHVPNKQQAYRWGVRTVKVQILK